MKNQFDHFKGWILKADSDLSNVSRTLNSDGPYDTACFHAQQAIEKTLKSFLAYHGLAIPRTHDLLELQRMCLEIDVIPNLAEIDLAEVATYVVSARYDFDFWPERQESEESYELAKRIKEIILDVIPEKYKP